MLMKVRADQYKKQIKKWHWVKNVREDDAIWMARKTNQRREENKDTTFTYHGRTLTQEEIMQRIGRKKTTLVDLATYTGEWWHASSRYMIGVD